MFVVIQNLIDTNPGRTKIEAAVTDIKYIYRNRLGQVKLPEAKNYKRIITITAKTAIVGKAAI